MPHRPPNPHARTCVTLGNGCAATVCPHTPPATPRVRCLCSFAPAECCPRTHHHAGRPMRGCAPVPAATFMQAPGVDAVILFWRQQAQNVRRGQLHHLHMCCMRSSRLGPQWKRGWAKQAVRTSGVSKHSDEQAVRTAATAAHGPVVHAAVRRAGGGRGAARTPARWPGTTGRLRGRTPHRTGWACTPLGQPSGSRLRTTRPQEVVSLIGEGIDS